MTDADEGALDGLSIGEMAAVLARLERREPGKLRDRPYGIARIRRAVARSGIDLADAMRTGGLAVPGNGPVSDEEVLAEMMADLMFTESEARALLSRDGEAEMLAYLGLNPGPDHPQPATGKP